MQRSMANSVPLQGARKKASQPRLRLFAPSSSGPPVPGPCTPCPLGPVSTRPRKSDVNIMQQNPAVQLPGSTMFWSFGFGSNMNVEQAKSKKGLNVLDHVCASLSGWKIAFTMGGMELVEPSFADAKKTGNASDEIHGVALALSAEDMAKLDGQEGVGHPTRGYRKESVKIQAYDGRELDAYLYVAKNAREGEIPCSQRYLRVLVSGARAAGLNASYLDKLAARPTYTPSEETIKIRESLPAMADLPRMSVAELAAAKDDTHELVSVMGYVVRVPKEKVFFGRHKARDITSRQSRQWRGLPLDDGDDLGRPPFALPGGTSLLREPCVAPDCEEADATRRGAMTPAEHRFVLCWLDHYLWKAGEGCRVVAFVSEMRDQWEAARSQVEQESAGG